MDAAQAEAIEADAHAFMAERDARLAASGPLPLHGLASALYVSAAGKLGASAAIFTQAADVISALAQPSYADWPARAVIEGDNVVIRVPISALATAAEVAFDETYGFDEHDLKVFDPVAFAPGFVSQLNDEEEDGTTLIHTMLDAAIIAATEDGADGVTGGES